MNNKWQRKHISDEAVCLACFLAHKYQSGKMSWQIIKEAFPGCPEKVIYAAMARADNKGLIEWGVSLRSAWITEKGRFLLFMRAGILNQHEQQVKAQWA